RHAALGHQARRAAADAETAHVVEAVVRLTRADQAIVAEIFVPDDSLRALLVARRQAVLDLLRPVELLTLRSAHIAALDVAATLKAARLRVLDTVGPLNLRNAAAMSAALGSREARSMARALHLGIRSSVAAAAEACEARTMFGALLHGKAAEVPAASAVALEGLPLDGESAASAVAATSAAAAHERGGATAATVAAATTMLNGRGLDAIAVATAVAATRLCCRGDRDRQGGDARSEKQPGHRISPFERPKRPISRAVPLSGRKGRASTALA
ncbi:MAG TPA: hypothetical protein VF757_09675, partial [Sphingomicrobium sp.]